MYIEKLVDVKLKYFKWGENIREEQKLSLLFQDWQFPGFDLAI